MTPLTDLIARVEAATGPDREIDAMVLVMFPPMLCEGAWVDRDRVTVWSRGGFVRLDAPAYSASIDAVVALIRREMPDYEERVATAPGGWCCVEAEYKAKNGQWYGIPSDDPRPEPLARLLAFLRAVQARQEQAG